MAGPASLCPISEIRDSDIQELHAYPDAEVPAALARLLESPVLERVRGSFFPGVPPEDFVKRVRAIRTSREFQEGVVAPAIDVMLARLSGGLTVGGIERNPAGRRHVYISNHRDIVLDPSLFTYGLVRNGRESPLICLGDNLLSAPWIIDLVKVNRGVTVKRDLSQRELLRWSQVLSELIHRAVRGGDSVWIAQREGRAKDGDDRTHPGILKMLALSKQEALIDRIAALNIVPISISYEYDPCDALKAREVWRASLPEGYRKSPGEDVASMGLGIRGHKGRIHIEIGREIADAVEQARALPSRPDQVRVLTTELDRQIHLNYRLWPSNHVAFDLLEGRPADGARYSEAERRHFLDRLEAQLDSLKEAPEAREPIRAQLLAMYANPVRNSLAWRA